MNLSFRLMTFGLVLALAGGASAGPVVLVDWVEGAGNQYVDIGLKAESGLKAEIDMEWTDPDPDKVFMGCSISTTSHYDGNFWFLGSNNSNAQRGLYNGYRNATSYAKKFPEANVRTLYTSVLDAGLQEVSTNGVALLTKADANPFDSATGYGTIPGEEGGWSIYVFANHTRKSGAVGAIYQAKAKCYGIKVWKKAAGNTTPGDYTGATLVRDLKPAVQDGNAGLWDEVTQRFYPGQGSYAQAPSYLKYPAGKTYEWTGAGNDGKWSTPANWKVDGETATVPPYSLCNLVFGAEASGESENDIDGLCLEKISFAHASKVVLRGKAITLYGTGCVMPCDTGHASIEIHNDLILTVDGQSFGNDKNCGAGATVGFYGNIEAEGLSIGMSFDNNNKWEQTVDFYGRVTAAALSLGEVNGAQCFYHFHSSGNPIGFLTTNWGYGPSYDAENALTADTVLSFSHARPENHPHCQSHYLCADQVANCIVSDPLPPKFYDIDHIQGYDNKPHTLTLRGSQDAVTSCVLQHKISLVWDPVGDYTQTFLDRVHTTTGSLTVKGGTLRSGGTNSFSSVSRLVIAAGATFDAASTNTGLFAACKDVSIGDGGTLKLGGGVADPFPADAVVTMSSGARIEAADDTPAFSLGNVVIDGVPLVAGDYTGAGGTSGTVIPQIVGKVKVSVTGCAGTYWSGAAGDRFNVADNWTAGVPASGNPATIGKYGTYTVKLDDPATPETGDLRLLADSNDVGVKTLEVSTAATIGGTLTFGRGGRIVVAEGGDLTLAERPVWQEGGTIEVEGTLRTKKTQSNVSYVKGADVKISGHGQWLQSNADDAWPSMSLDSVGGVTNCFEIGDNGLFDWGAEISMPSAFHLNWYNANGVMGLKLAGNGFAKLGRTFNVAVGSGSKAFVEMRGDSYLLNRYYCATFGKSGEDSANPAVGELYMKGGCFDHYVSNNETNNYNGLTFGSSEAGSGACSIGRLYLEDGVVTNRGNGLVYLGVGPARGEVHQTGGRFIACQVAQRHYEQTVVECERPIILGMCGGEGIWEMSGGYVECSRFVFVGGCTPEYIGKNPLKFPEKAPGRGLLKITGGEYKVAEDVVVSYAGEGTVEIGAGGLLTAKNLELCDPEYEEFGATLRFRPGDGTSGKVTLSGALKLGTRSKVVVDASNWSDETCGLVTLLEAGTALPESGDWLVVENLPPHGTVTVRGNRLRMGIPRGMAIIVR